jgi:hypothetical protein
VGFFALIVVPNALPVKFCAGKTNALLTIEGTDRWLVRDEDKTNSIANLQTVLNAC